MKRTDRDRKKIVILSFTRAGLQLSLRMRDVLEATLREEDLEAGSVTLFTTNAAVADQHNDVIRVTEGLKTWCQSVFSSSDVLIFVGASGIAVRTIAPFVESKTSDPAVLVADERGRYVISLLSGHLGGGNEFARYLSDAIGAEPVITTASDVNGKIAIDVWARRNQLVISDMEAAKRVAADIVDGKRIPFYCQGEIGGPVPEELLPMRAADDRIAADEDGSRANIISDYLIYVSPFAFSDPSERRTDDPEEVPHVLHLIPRTFILGIGCKKGKEFEEIRSLVFRILKENRIAANSIAAVASIDLKADEPGLQNLADVLQCPFVTFSAEALRAVPGDFSASEFVQKTTGVDNVCERSAMAALAPAQRADAHFLCKKTAGEGVTVAILEKKWGVTFA